MRHHEHVGRKKARALIARTGHHLGKAGGHFAHGGETSDWAQDKRMIERGIHEHERKMHPGEKETKLKLADGGHAMGDMASSRADRSPRGKAGKGKQTHIAIVVNPGGGQAQGAHPVPVPVPVPAGGGAPPMPPPRPAMPPPGPPMGAAMPPRPMVPPPGAGVPPGAPMMHKAGGRTRGRPPMTAGQGSGEGRLEQSRALDYCAGGRS